MSSRPNVPGTGDQHPILATRSDHAASATARFVWAPALQVGSVASVSQLEKAAGESRNAGADISRPGTLRAHSRLAACIHGLFSQRTGLIIPSVRPTCAAAIFVAT